MSGSGSMYDKGSCGATSTEKHDEAGQSVADQTCDRPTHTDPIHKDFRKGEFVE